MTTTPTYRRWATAYATAVTLLAGWLFFEKMPDGREELLGSVERTFRESGEVAKREMARHIPDIQDIVEDYFFIPSYRDYGSRAERALKLIANMASGDNYNPALFQSHRDSLLQWADHDPQVQAMEPPQYNGCCKKLIVSQFNVKEYLLAASVFNYCSTKITGGCGGPDRYVPSFGPSTLAPKVGEPFQADISLTTYGSADIRYSDTCLFNDRPHPLKEGIATLRTTFTTPGQHTLRLRFRRELCRDSSVTEIAGDFRVNVLERCR